MNTAVVDLPTLPRTAALGKVNLLFWDLFKRFVPAKSTVDGPQCRKPARNCRQTVYVMELLIVIYTQ